VTANRLRGDRGMVTAELAMALPVLIIVLAAGLAAVTVVGQRVRAEDAAREAARAAARGDTAAAHRLVSQVAPGASVSMSQSADRTTARVSVVVHPLGAWPALTVAATAVAATEPDADDESEWPLVTGHVP
jgi:Flp pilus assembly protein TadG